jgi:hypothetical protein
MEIGPEIADREPLPGMVKRQCPQCRYWFAVAVEVAEEAPVCPDCSMRELRSKLSE